MKIHAVAWVSLFHLQKPECFSVSCSWYTQDPSPATRSMQRALCCRHFCCIRPMHHRRQGQTPGRRIAGREECTSRNGVQCGPASANVVRFGAEVWKKNSRRHAIKTKNIETHRYHLCLMWNFNEFFMVIEVELGIFEPCFNHAAVKSADSSLALILRCPNSVANDDWEPKLPARHSQPRVSFLAKEHHLTAGDFCYFWCFTTVPPIRRSILERTHVQPGHVEAATGEAHGATDSHLSARLRATCSWCHLALNASPATIQHIPKNGPMPWAKG